MALFDRNDDRGYGNRGWGDEHLRRDYENRDTMDAGGNYDAGPRSRGREGLWANSWADGAWTADAADHMDRDWNLGGRHAYDRDWRGGGMNRGASGGMGMGRGGMDRDHGWNLGSGDRDWGHNWGSGSMGGGYGAGGPGRDRGWDDRGGMNRGGGWMDRAQNAVRRGWQQVEDAFDRDDDRHLGGGAMRGGTSWAGSYDRDFGGMRGGGMNRYGGDFDRGGRGWGARGGMNRYGGDYGRGRNWF